MGTNFYVTENECSCCKRYDEVYHIGKSSFGWAFSFRGYRSEGLTSWMAWKEFLRNKHIKDEYSDSIDYDKFVSMIETEKAPEYVYPSGAQNKIHNQGWWFDPRYDWDDPQGYSFTSREFS